MKNKFFIKSLIRLSIILSGVTIFFSVSNAETKARKSIKLSDVKISIEKLKELAFKHSKVEPKDARITKIKLDKENKKFFYEMEFFTEKRKYEYNIDADTGKILSYSQKVREIVSNTVNIEKPEMLDVKMNEDENKIFNPLKYISEDEVKEIIIKRITGSKKENIIRLKLDDDDGKIIYEGRMVYQNTEYNFKLDALTGEVISWEVNEK